MKKNLTNLRAAFYEVFAVNSYIALASALAIAAFLFAVWFPNFGLIGEVWGSSRAPLAVKLKIMVALLGGIGTNFSFLSAGYTIAIAALFGINFAMVVYFLKRTRLRQARMPASSELQRDEPNGQTRAGLGGQNFAAEIGGIASGVLGLGCAACGSFILSTILSSFGAAGALAILPLRGGEFGILSVALLAFSLILISKKIAAPLTC